MQSGTIVTYEKWGHTDEVEGKQQEGGTKTAEKVAHVSFWKGAGGAVGVSRCFWLAGLLSIITLSLFFFFVRDCPHRSTPGPLSDRQEVEGGGAVQKVCTAGCRLFFFFFLQCDLMKRSRSKRQLLILFPLPFPLIILR